MYMEQGGVDTLGRSAWEVSLMRSEWARVRSYPWHRCADRLSRVPDRNKEDGGGAGMGVLQVASGRAGEQFDHDGNLDSLYRTMRQPGLRSTLRKRVAMPGLWTFDILRIHERAWLGWRLTAGGSPQHRRRRRRRHLRHSAGS